MLVVVATSTDVVVAFVVVVVASYGCCCYCWCWCLLWLLLLLLLLLLVLVVVVVIAVAVVAAFVVVVASFVFNLFIITHNTLLDKTFEFDIGTWMTLTFKVKRTILKRNDIFKSPWYHLDLIKTVKIILLKLTKIDVILHLNNTCIWITQHLLLNWHV